MSDQKKIDKRAPEIHASGINNERDNRWKPWHLPISYPDQTQRRKMIVESMKVGLNLIMKNHVYYYDGDIRRQRNGGPIGLKLTGTLAQVFMLWWDQRFKEKLVEAGIDVPLNKRYVDDINMCAYELKGTDDGQGGQNTEETEKQGDAWLFEKIQEVGNSIHDSIQLEVDYPSNHADRKIPILDVKVWVEDGRKLMYEYYAKDVSSKSVLNAKSALAWSTKRTVLTQELLRVLMNCSPDLGVERKVIHVETMVLRMQYSGYDHKFRAEVVDSAYKAYEKVKEAVSRAERPLHRPRSWKKAEREKEKTDRKRNWYKRGGYDSVMFIPATPNSELRRILQDEAGKSRFRIRMVEMAGTSLKRNLQRSDPFRGTSCKRGNCAVCTSGGSGRCDRNGVVYKITCGECTMNYHGETARNAYSRCGEHRDELRRKSANSVLWKHCVEKHGGTEPDFKYHVIKIFGNDTMLRQITEAVMVRSDGKGMAMNNKTEWNQPRVPQVTIQ